MGLDRWDVLCVLGVVLLGLGLALLAPWLGVTAAGVVLLVLGVLGAYSAESSTGTTDGG